MYGLMEATSVPTGAARIARLCGVKKGQLACHDGQVASAAERLYSLIA